MAKKKQNQTDDQFVAVEEALSKTEQFIENNQKTLTTIVLIIAAIVLAYFGFRKFYLQPQQKEAQAEMFMAQKYFEQDSLNLALNGDGNYPGFLQIIDDYGMTQSANLANYYVGVIYLNQGKFENAIDFLKDFEADDQMVAPMAKSAIGDAYMELDQPDEAVSYYMEAANMKEDNFTTPKYLMKAGRTYEILGEYDNAEDAYQRIKKDFPESTESRGIEKYIARTQTKAEG
ncbi:MAG: tetratricopeptide repeat protein [Bacteroidales bacterium]|nr:tetratricopeptide repeat protein [Bacteroidales bacterium]